MDCALGGKLYIVATPIGHLDDVTYRAVRVLRSVDIVLAEDTREAIKLLNKYDIKKPIIPYTDQKHSKNIKKILENLQQGKSIALTSDSGTPLISDPGLKLVKKVRAEGHCVISIPGPSSPIAALVISGLPTDKFLFLGFLPKSKTKRENLLKSYKDFDGSIIIFESPYKIKHLLDEVFSHLGNRPVCLVKDITKKFEKITTSKIGDIKIPDIKEKGEYILIIAKEGYDLNG